VLRFSNKSDFVLQRWHSMKTYSCLFPLMFNLIRINFLLQFEFWDYFFYLVDKIVRTFFIINFSSCWSCEGFLFQIVPTFLSILFKIKLFQLFLFNFSFRPAQAETSVFGATARHRKDRWRNRRRTRRVPIPGHFATSVDYIFLCLCLCLPESLSLFAYQWLFNVSAHRTLQPW
jgi:hypothetical protein